MKINAITGNLLAINLFDCAKYEPSGFINNITSNLLEPGEEANWLHSSTTFQTIFTSYFEKPFLFTFWIQYKILV